jgi:hypothetical protein
MAAFVYYNPKTNTIERKFPTQPMSFQMPYLLNIQPQDINLAMRNTVDVRANPANFQQPSESFLPQYPPQEKVENFRLTKKVEKEMPKNSSLPPQRDREEHSILNNPAPPSNNFLMMEDLREEDLNSIPDYYQAPAVEPKTRSSFKAQSFEPEKALKKKPTFPDVQQNYKQKEARGDFKLVRHEDLMLNYRPEDYSINERILNAKYVREEQEKTKKFMLDRMGNDLKAMEKAATMFEKDIEQTGKDTQDLEEKTKKIWEEVERKRFELKAQEIMNNVDRAVEIGHDLDEEDRINQLLKENRALYDEIDKVLEGDAYEEGPTQYSLYTVPDTHKSSSSKTKGTSIRRPGSSQTRPAFDTSKSIVEQKFGRKNIVKTVSENKIKGATRVQMGSPGKKKTTTSNKGNAMFKNPKKVEEALQKAREIADLY